MVMLLWKDSIKATPRSAASLVTFSPRTIDSPFWKSCKNAARTVRAAFHTRSAPTARFGLLYRNILLPVLVIREVNWLKKTKFPGERKSEKKNQFIIFLSVKRPFNINIIICNFVGSLGIGKWDKIGGESRENAKKCDSIFKFVERPLNIFCQA